MARIYIILLLTLAALCSGTAALAEACTVNDPTGTPLNVRAQPEGKILGALNNGTQVLVRETKGKWARVAPMMDNAKDGWVFKEYVVCMRVDNRGDHFELSCGETVVSVERLDVSSGGYEITFQMSHKKPIDFRFQWTPSGGYLNGKQCKELKDGP
jgi:hypothetical protein